MASAKGKVSKNSRTSKKVQEYIKPIKPKKKEILIELTDKVMCEIRSNPETGLVEEYLGKPIKSIVSKFGKKYLLCENI